MNAPKQLTARYYTQEYLKNYAALFAHISEGEEDQARLVVAKMKVIERQAESLLDQASQNRFISQRQKLCRLFKRRLLCEVQDQVEKGIIDRTEELIAAYNTHTQH